MNSRACTCRVDKSMNSRIEKTELRVTSPREFLSRRVIVESRRQNVPISTRSHGRRRVASRRGAFHLKRNANARRTVCANAREPGITPPRLTLATVETVVREKYYYPGKSGGVPSRCQIGHVRMETRRKFLHPRRDLSRS